MDLFIVGIHAALGEMGALAFLWVFVELLSPRESRIKRATWVAFIGVVLLFASWIVGGYNYLELYQGAVKETIKSGPMPWAHSVITETKEHVFLFIPFLALLVWGMLKAYGTTLATDRNARISVLIISILIVLTSFAMAGMGFIISSGFRSALEATAL